MSHAFGRELHRLRTEAHLSVHKLARLAACNAGHISKMENGLRNPTRTMAAALDTALNARGGLLAVLDVKEVGEDVERRRVLGALTAAGLALAGWPVQSRDLPRRVGTDHVTDVVESTGVYRGWVSRHGGTAVRRPAAELLERVSALHGAATDRNVRQALLVAIADLAGLGAYIARDVGDHASAGEHARLALSAAKAAGNTALGGHTVVRMAGHAIELRQPEQVLTYLDAARQAHSLFTSGDRANQRCIEAWAHAQTGDAEAVHRAVGEAEHEFTRSGSGQAPGWAAQHVTEAELWSLTGAAYVELARRPPDHAATGIDRLNRALDLRGVSLARNRVLDQISMAEAMLYTGEIDEAGRVACNATASATGIVSGRLDLRLADLDRRLRPHARTSEPVAQYLSARRGQNQHRSDARSLSTPSDSGEPQEQTPTPPGQR